MMMEAMFIGVSLILDMILTVLFPFDFAMIRPVFIPCVGICGRSGI